MGTCIWAVVLVNRSVALCVGVQGVRGMRGPAWVRGVGGVRGVRGRAWACGAELPPVQLLADTTLLSLCSSQPLCTELQMQREPVTKEGSGLNAEQV